MVSTPSEKEPLVESEIVALLPERTISAFGVSELTLLISLSENISEVLMSEDVSVTVLSAAEEVLDVSEATEEAFDAAEDVLLSEELEQPEIIAAASTIDRKRINDLFFIQ